jgi:hypothetical protein
MMQSSLVFRKHVGTVKLLALPPSAALSPSYPSIWLTITHDRISASLKKAS